MHPALTELRELGLERADHALFGSGPLLVRGWIDEVGDLEVIARGTAWEQAQEIGELVHLDAYNVDIVEIGDMITVGTSWGYGDVDIDHLIDTAEDIDGIRCVQLQHVVAYKRVAARPKDLAHLDIIDQHAPGL